MSKYQEYSLEELITYISRGITPKYTEEVNNSAIIINQKCIRDFQINFEPSRRNNLTQRIISEEKKVKLFDILINSTGVGTLGRVAQFLDDKIKEIISVDTHVTIVRPDIKKINPLFLGYLVKSKQSEIESFGIGSTGQTELSRDALKSIRFNVPTDRNRQKEITEFFLQIDQKIQLNTQINQTLEQIAQALFKSWFVDFDPVRAKVQALSDDLSIEQAELAAMQAISGKTAEELTALSQTQPDRYAKLVETAKAFPCEMVEVEGVEVPKGWEYCSFGDVSECFDSKRIPLSKQQREKRKGNIPYYGATSVMDYVDEAIFDDIYLLVGEDGSVLKEDGTPFTQYIWGKSWVNNHAHVLKGRNGISTEHLMIFIQQTNISAYITGAVQLKLNQKNMNSIPFLKANNAINAFFAEYIESLYAKIRKNFDENKVLEATRDLLLPKLLSGNFSNGKN